jgi:hypothetical protein
MHAVVHRTIESAPHSCGDSWRFDMRLVMVVLDAFPNSLVSPDHTPNLHELVRNGARQRLGGIAEMTAATYPNHATFVTGVSTVEHAVMTNRVRRDDLWVPAAMVGPAAPTLFEACRAEGRSSVAIVGDHNLVGVCGAAVADEHWPSNGVKPNDAKRGMSGYLADSEVLRAAAGLDLTQFDFCFFQLDEVDGVRHAHGAWSEEALDQVRRTDHSLGLLTELLRPGWDDTVMFVVSDHDQEDVSDLDPIDLGPLLPDHLDWDPQGTAAVVVGSVHNDVLHAIPGIDGVASLDDSHHVVWGAEGQLFGADHGCRAEHGSPRTGTQLAIVAGGHPATRQIERRLLAQRPKATRWAEWGAELLGLSWLPQPSRRLVPHA